MAIGHEENVCEDEGPNTEPFQDQQSLSEATELVAGEHPKSEMDQKSRLFLKSVYFSMFAAIGVIASFFSLYLKELGMSPSIIGTVLFFRPVGGFIAGIVSPTIVAKFHNERKALLGFTVLFLVFMFSISFFPASSFKEYCPIESFTQITGSIPNATIYVNQTVLNHQQRLASKYENNSTIFMSNNTPGYVKSDNFKIDVNDENARNESTADLTDSEVGGNGFNLSDIETKDNSWMFETDRLTVIILVLASLVFSGEFCFVSLDTVVHGITMRNLGEGNSKQYGVFRAWGAIGHGTGAILTGAVVALTLRDVTICEETFQRGDYHAMFYVFFGLALLTCVNVTNIGKVHTDGRDNSMEKIPIDDRDNSTKKIPSGDLRRALCTVRNIAWLFVLFARSMFYAVTQGFLYWHMDNIGASPLLIGIANCITTTTEFLAFFVTPKLIEIFGETKLVGIGLISYICRFILYSVIVNPIYILPMEVVEGVAFACVWSSILSYLSGQVSAEGQIQIAGIIQTLNMSGTGVGFLLSGALVEVIGTSAMFLTLAGIASVTVLIFSLSQVVCKWVTRGK